LTIVLAKNKRRFCSHFLWEGHPAFHTHKMTEKTLVGPPGKSACYLFRKYWGGLQKIK
jgi:hypothetical protein